jgi:hypothetical protein
MLAFYFAAKKNRCSFQRVVSGTWSKDRVLGLNDKTQIGSAVLTKKLDLTIFIVG